MQIISKIFNIIFTHTMQRIHIQEIQYLDETMVQNYMIIEAINLWVYDEHHKKRRWFTLRVSSSERRNLYAQDRIKLLLLQLGFCPD